ncbi:MAG: hypothetical protein JWM90_323, partial [Thermoleophilia bacterium]|nr:hypothetical protein [Thermoleophilia bacterium]
MRPARQRPRRTVLAHVLAACALAGSIAAATPATSISASSASTTVVMSVSPVTTVDGAGCSTGAAVNFGMISLNTGQVTTADCDVIFGSSGGTAQLQVKQTDNAGAAMWSPTTGTLDVAWDGAAAGNGAFAQAVSANRDEAYAAATLPDGNVLAIGTCNVGGFDSLCMTRHLPTGVLDVTFDGPSGTGNGIVTTNVGAGMSDWIGSIALMADGRFLVGGDCWS